MQKFTKDSPVFSLSPSISKKPPTSPTQSSAESSKGKLLPQVDRSEEIKIFQVPPLPHSVIKDQVSNKSTSISHCPNLHQVGMYLNSPMCPDADSHFHECVLLFLNTALYVPRSLFL
jgi:hypothetical protein